jgi:hypothetical protein
MGSVAPKMRLARTVSLRLSNAALAAAGARGGEIAGGAAPATVPPGRMLLGKPARLPAAYTGTSRAFQPHGRDSPGIPRRTPGRVRATREGQRNHPQEGWR